MKAIKKRRRGKKTGGAKEGGGQRAFQYPRIFRESYYPLFIDGGKNLQKEWGGRKCDARLFISVTCK